MGLLIWLPLTKDLRNQGLSSMTFSNTGGTQILYNSLGKLGGCWERNGTNDNYRVISSEKINLSEDLSMCCWAYVSKTIGDTANGLITNHNAAKNSGVSINVKLVSTDDYRISCSTGYQTGRTYASYYGTTNIKDSWHHLALTYSREKQQLKLWVDGICEYTLDNYNNYAYEEYFSIFEWNLSGVLKLYKPLCKLNDVRVYDHCLSPREVKDIAKGLVLHYPLNLDEYHENLLIDSESLDIVSGSDSGVKDRSTRSTYYIGNILVNRMERTASGNCYGYGFVYISSKGYYKYFPLKPNTNYTISADIKSTCSGVFRIDSRPSFLNLGNCSFTNTNGVWKRFSATYTTPSDIESDTALVGLIWIADVNIGDYVELKCLKLEEGNKATPWGIGDTVYDVSGYENNGTVTGNLYAEEDSPRYDKNTIFNTSSYFTCKNLFSNFILNELSISYWVKIPDNTVATTNIKLANGTNYFKTYFVYNKYRTGLSWKMYKDDETIEGNTSATGTTTSAEPNIWYHLVYIFNKGVIKHYINSKVVEISDRTATATRTILSGDTVIGGFNGSMSDVRIYFTALSADDIKELYETSAFITNNNILESYLFNEDDNVQINKTGVLEQKDFVEINSDKYIYLPAGVYITTGVTYTTTDTFKCITTLKWDSGTTRDLMGYEGNGYGYFGVAANENLWDSIGSYEFINNNEDPTIIQTIIKSQSYRNSSYERAGTFQIGALLSTYSTRGKYIYNVKLYKNNILQEDLYPYEKDGTYGVIDILTNTFYATNKEGASIGYSGVLISNTQLSSNQIIEI